MPFRRQLGLCILLAGAVFSMATYIMRIITAQQETSITQTSMGMLWAGLEQCLVITLGAAPTLPALRQTKLKFLRKCRLVAG